MYRQLLFSGLICLSWTATGLLAADPVMRSHHVDVGQGAATLLEFPCGAVLIDTGAQDADHAEVLADYLANFFQSRPDLNDTLASLIISHPHIDHTRGIKAVAQVCRIRNFVDSGIVQGSGGAQVQWVRNEVEAGRLNTVVREVTDDEVVELPNKQGLTDDPVSNRSCS
jgi:competence protein ComEC